MGDSYFAKDISELLSPSELGKMSGLQFLQRIADGSLPQPPIGQALNYRLTIAERGAVTFEGEVDFGHLNPLGTTHGGWFGTLLDSCMACSVQSCLPAGQGYTTLEYKINIIRPIYPGPASYIATGQADHVGRRTGISHGEIRGKDDGKLYATGSTTCLIFDLPKGG